MKSKEKLKTIINDFVKLNEDDFRAKYNFIFDEWTSQDILIFIKALKFVLNQWRSVS